MPGGVWLVCVGHGLSVFVCLGPCVAVTWPVVASIPSRACTASVLSLQHLSVACLGTRAAGCCGMVVADCWLCLPWLVIGRGVAPKSSNGLVGPIGLA